MSKFDLFIGVDWSGADKEFMRGIQVAVARPGEDAPKTINPPNPKGWSREAVIDYIKNKAKKLKDDDKRVLAGFDFAFAHPFGENGYYPGINDAPNNACTLWQMIDEISHAQDEKHLYGGGIWADPTYGPYYNAPKRKHQVRDGWEKKYESRKRYTEKMARAMPNGRSPSPTFNCVGPAGVGTGSLAGMRMLHRLRHAREASIWPMVETSDTNLTVVEIFPALYFSMAEVSDAEKKNNPLAALNVALKWWQSDTVGALAEGLPDNDDVDALVSAAALRVLGGEGLPVLPDEVKEDACREGWIFGVDWPDGTLFNKICRKEADNETHQEDEEDDKE